MSGVEAVWWSIAVPLLVLNAFIDILRATARWWLARPSGQEGK